MYLFFSTNGKCPKRYQERWKISILAFVFMLQHKLCLGVVAKSSNPFNICWNLFLTLGSFSSYIFVFLKNNLPMTTKAKNRQFRLTFFIYCSLLIFFLSIMFKILDSRWTRPKNNLVKPLLRLKFRDRIIHFLNFI